MFVGGLPSRSKERNGAKAYRWGQRQPYDVDAAAANPETPESVLLDIVENGTSKQVIKIASNKGASSVVLEAVYKNKHRNTAVDARLASRRDTPGWILVGLANFYRYNRATMIARIASNPSTPVDILLTMLPDADYKRDPWVVEITPGRESIMNPSVPVHAAMQSLKYLKTDEFRAKATKRLIKKLRSSNEEFKGWPEEWIITYFETEQNLSNS